MLAKKIGLFILSALSGFSLAAQTGPAAAAAPAENSLLWEISGEQVSRPSYLYGTIHLIGKNDFFLTEATRTAFERSELVAFEINLEEMSNPLALLPIMTKAFMRGDTTLRDLLDEESLSLVKGHFQKIGLPFAFFERIKPMFLAALAGEEALGGAEGRDGVTSYELEFMSMARRAGKKMAGLETIEFQLSLFDSIPYAVQAQMLVESIRGGDEGGQIDQLVALYKAQNLEGLRAMIQKEGASFSAYEELLLHQRNRKWIPAMENMMKRQQVFFAVGAGHLPGPQGVIALLRSAGYTLRPLH
jgi:uncharacterized protein YbaP (TraB family)